MVNLTRIYTKTGDDGTTSLGDMSRTSKNDPRLEAYATVDEANSAIGAALALGNIEGEIKELLIRVQNDLFDVGADLCTPVVDDPKVTPLRVIQGQIDYLEVEIDSTTASSQSFAHSYFQVAQPQRLFYMLHVLSPVAQSEILGMPFTPLALASIRSRQST